jgi:hypothetical protein
MKNGKIILLSLFVLGACLMLDAQNKVTYGYDAAGNRISRTIVIIRSSSDDVVEEEEEEAVYSEMLSDIELKIYPNPTTGLLKVEIYNLPKGRTANIWMYDLSGKLINSFKKVSDFVTIDISAQPEGMYLMKIAAGEYQTEWKIIKK